MPNELSSNSSSIQLFAKPSDRTFQLYVVHETGRNFGSITNQDLLGPGPWRIGESGREGKTKLHQQLTPLIRQRARAAPAKRRRRIEKAMRAIERERVAAAVRCTYIFFCGTDRHNYIH